jgi:hypothetical protein
MAGMFVLLIFIALATAGLTGYVIFAPLTWRHLQDRGRSAEAGGSPVTPGGLIWLLRGGFVPMRDPGLNGLARPAQILGWCLVIGLAGCAAVYLSGWAP